MGTHFKTVLFVPAFARTRVCPYVQRHSGEGTPRLHISEVGRVSRPVTVTIVVLLVSAELTFRGLCRPWITPVLARKKTGREIRPTSAFLQRWGSDSRTTQFSTSVWWKGASSTRTDDELSSITRSVITPARPAVTVISSS